MRKVRPITFVSRGQEGAVFRRTVTANVSRGGMLLVSRKDQFPPAGAALTVTPYDPDSDSGDAQGHPIAGRIVYTRFSPRTELRFAGLKFETELTETDAHSIGLDTPPDAVARTLQALERVEALAGRTSPTSRVNLAPSTTKSISRELGMVRHRMDDACAEFLRATERFIVEWGDTRLRETVAERHALARAKGATGLRAFKDEWRSLKEDMAGLVDAQLNRDSLWPHRMLADSDRAPDPQEVWFYDGERDRPPQRIMDELRKLAGFIGRISIRHGFEDLSNDSDWVPIAHERALVSYRGRLSISDTMREALVRGACIQEDARTLLARAEEAADLDARGEALRLWDSV
jgi:hypothetical protein